MLAVSPVSDDASLVKVPSLCMLWSLDYINLFLACLAFVWYLKKHLPACLGHSFTDILAKSHRTFSLMHNALYELDR